MYVIGTASLVMAGEVETSVCTRLPCVPEPLCGPLQETLCSARGVLISIIWHVASGDQTTSVSVQGTWVFCHHIRDSSSQRLMGTWRPLIHAPHVKSTTTVSVETSIPGQTFQSELSSEHKSGVYLTYFCSSLASKWNATNVLRHYLIWERPAFSEEGFLSRNQRQLSVMV